jgi:hypothetical protein
MDVSAQLEPRSAQKKAIQGLFAAAIVIDSGMVLNRQTWHAGRRSVLHEPQELA